MTINWHQCRRVIRSSKKTDLFQESSKGEVSDMVNSKTLTLLLCAAVAVGAFPFAAPDARAGLKSGKVIQWGDAPPTTCMKDHIDEMEQLPFDGVVMGIQPNAGAKNISWDIWGPTKLRAEDYSRSIEALKSTKFKRFTDNFLTLNVAPGYIDWFDEDFSTVIANVRLLARITKECRIKGILLDVEQYEGQPFCYQAQRQWDEHSFADYQTQVRKRGREFIKAINAEYPDATILLTFGYTIAYGNTTKAGDTLEKSSYGLLTAFIDGLLDAAGPKTRIHDGYEHAYGFKTESEFAGARDTMLKKGLEWTASKERFPEHYSNSSGM